MGLYFFILLICVSTLQAVSSDSTKEPVPSASKSNENTKQPLKPTPPSEATGDAASRQKRENRYDMLRLTRGLHMLRLGKRDQSPNTVESDIDENEFYPIPDSPYSSMLYDNLLSSIDLSPSSSSYISGYPEYLEAISDHMGSRVRRSTPRHSGVLVTPSTSSQMNGDGINDMNEINPSVVLEGDDDEPDNDDFYMYPSLKNDDDFNNIDEFSDDDDMNPEGFPKYNDGFEEKRNLAMMRLGKRFYNPVMRLGKRQDENLNSDFTGEGVGNDVNKRSMSLLRLGKKDSGIEDGEDTVDEDGDEKRAINMMRLGKKSTDFDGDMWKKNNLQLLRLGKKMDPEVYKKNALGLLRLGKRQGGMSLLRLGKRGMNSLRLGKRGMNLLRLGKRRDLGLMSMRLGKRNMGLLRLGKKNMGLLRLGKKSMGLLRLGKRNMGLLRLGKKNMGLLRLGKRNMGLLRLGKRNMGLLRLGKKNMGLLRLGKKNMGLLRLGKKNMGLLRLGKREDGSDSNPMEENFENTQDMDKRPMNMLRLGKRSIGGGLESVRLGKRSSEDNVVSGN